MDAARRKRLELTAKQISVQQAELESLRDNEQTFVDELPNGDKADAAQDVVDKLSDAVDSVSSVVDRLNEVMEEDDEA